MRLYFVKSHVEKLESGTLTFVQGNFYIVDDEQLASSLRADGKALTEDEFNAKVADGELEAK